MFDKRVALQELQAWSQYVVGLLPPIGKMEYERSKTSLQMFADQWLQLEYDRDALLKEYNFSRKTSFFLSIAVLFIYFALIVAGFFPEFLLSQIVPILCIVFLPALNSYYLLNSFDRSAVSTRNSLRSLLSLSFIGFDAGLSYVNVYKMDPSAIPSLACREIILNEVLDIITDRKHSVTQPIYSFSDFGLD